MAEEKKKGYPMIAQGNWFSLRDKLKQKVPSEISGSYVASALSMGEASAKANVISPLKALGIIGDDFKPTDLAYDWRDDNKYSEVCETVIETVYPQELRDLFHSPDSKLADLTSWFMRDAKVGEAAARKYAATYLMLLQKKPGAAKEPPNSKPQKKQKQAKPASPSTQNTRTKENPTSEQNSRQSEGGNFGFSPKLHIDIQIHISPESSSEQIDKIFLFITDSVDDDADRSWSLRRANSPTSCWHTACR